MRVYVGQKYNEDKETVPAEIRYTLLTNYEISPFTTHNGPFEINGSQGEAGIVVSYKRTLSKLLAKDLKAGDGRQFLMGYFTGILPLLNEQLMHQKYTKGYTLVRPATFYDVIQIRVNDLDSGATAEFAGIIRLAPIVPKSAIALERPLVFVRDFLDAMAAFLYMNLEDCVRRLITSLENYFLWSKRKGKFNAKLDALMADCRLEVKYKKIVQDNIRLLYQARNQIIHDRMRASYDGNWMELTQKGIGTVHYAYSNTLPAGELNEYLQRAQLEYVSYKESFNLYDLDMIRRSFPLLETEPTAQGVSESIDDFMFRRLRFSDQLLNYINAFRSAGPSRSRHA
jgi:hypothetical protein